MTCSAEVICGSAADLERDFPDLVAGSEVVVCELLSGRAARRDEPARRSEDRVALVVCADRLRRSVRHLRVRAGVAQVAHRAEVEHRRPTPLAYPRRELRARPRAPRPGRARTRSRSAARSRAVSADSTQPGGVGTLMPSPLSSHTKQQRQRETLERDLRRRVERGLRGRMVQRRVAERAHDDRVARATGSARRGARHGRSRAPSPPRAEGATRSSTSSAAPRAPSGRRPCAARRRSARPPPRRRRA